MSGVRFYREDGAKRLPRDPHQVRVLRTQVFKAHRLVYHSTLGWRVIKHKKDTGLGFRGAGPVNMTIVQGYLAHKKPHPPRTLP